MLYSKEIQINSNTKINSIYGIMMKDKMIVPHLFFKKSTKQETSIKIETSWV